MKGYIYIASNRAYPGLVKIGKARLPRARAKQLSGATGVLYPFRLQAYFTSSDYTDDEQRAHRLLAQYRVNPRKEFFRLPIPQAIVELTALFGMEPKFSRPKHKAAQEQYQHDLAVKRAEDDERLKATQLKRRQEVEVLKQERKAKLRRDLTIYSLLGVGLVVILLAVRWLCFLT